jgi:hypothetical protein
MKKFLALFLLTALFGCSNEVEYTTFVWWDSASEPGARVRVLRNTQEGSTGQDAISAESVLNLAARDGWRLVSETRVKFGTEFRLERRARAKRVYYPVTISKPSH